jgi:hypothetical protein
VPTLRTWLGTDSIDGAAVAQSPPHLAAPEHPRITPMRLAAISLLGLIAAGVPALAARAAIPTVADAKTAAAVQAADDAWGAAEENGDAAFVDWLLLPGYRSVGTEGKATDKALIVARTGAHKDPQARAAQVAAWKASHPSRAAVTLYGDTAILTWVSTRLGGTEAVYSCDIFTYRDGHWHGVYSQHTAAA